MFALGGLIYCLAPGSFAAIERVERPLDSLCGSTTFRKRVGGVKHGVSMLSSSPKSLVRISDASGLGDPTSYVGYGKPK